MARYIDADKAIQQIRKQSSRSVARECAVNAVNNTPIEDVAPVIHAHWRWMLNHDVICSKCQYVLPSSSPVSDFRFCPFCGAKMDEE